MVHVAFHDLEQFAQQLSGCTALTSLELHPAVSHSVAGAWIAAVAVAFPLLTCLERLALGCSPPDSVAQKATILSRSTLDSLAGLSKLTALTFSGHTVAENPQQLDDLWPRMPQLAYLDVGSLGGWFRSIQSLRALSQLQHFRISAERMHSWDVRALAQSLPDSITSLELSCTYLCLAQLHNLANLRSISVCAHTLGDLTVQSLAAQTSLQRVSLKCAVEWVQPPSGALMRDPVRAHLTALPLSLTHLCMAGFSLSADAVPVLASFTALRRLIIWEVTSDDVFDSLALHVSALTELRNVTVSRPAHQVSSPAYGEMLRMLQSLPNFEGLDAGPDPQGVWTVK